MKCDSIPILCSVQCRVLNKWNARSNRSSMNVDGARKVSLYGSGCVGGGQVDKIFYGYDERTVNFNPGFSKSGGIGH